jgi:AcrR family transcriptional regulator
MGDWSVSPRREYLRVALRTKEATRESLLAAAADEFGRVGLERANVDAISVRAGYAKGTVYNYFASKEDLFLAVVERASTDAVASAPEPSAGRPRERVVAALEAFCGWVRDHDSFARVLVRECLMGTPSMYPRVIRAEQPLVEALGSILAALPPSQRVRHDVPPHVLALALAGLTDLALAQHWTSGGTEPSLTEIPELVTTLLLGPEPQTRGTL